MCCVADNMRKVSALILGADIQCWRWNEVVAWLSVVLVCMAVIRVGWTLWLLLVLFVIVLLQKCVVWCWLDSVAIYCWTSPNYNWRALTVTWSMAIFVFIECSESILSSLTFLFEAIVVFLVLLIDSYFYNNGVQWANSIFITDFFFWSHCGGIVGTHGVVCFMVSTSSFCFSCFLCFVVWSQLELFGDQPIFVGWIIKFILILL